MSQAPTPRGAAAVNAPHVIRLRRPWLNDQAADSQAVTCIRRFGAPSNLAAGDCVELVLAGMIGLDAVWLNGRRLEVDTSAEHVRVDVTGELASRNELKLVIQERQRHVRGNPQTTVETWQDGGAVRLEISPRQQSPVCD